MKKITFLFLITFIHLSFSQQGSIDNTFNFGIGSTYAYNLAIQSDNKIIAMINQLNVQAIKHVIRINPDGSSDNFNDNFLVSGASNVSNKLCIQNDGKILIGGSYQWWNGNGNLNLIRLNSDGTLDNHFTNLGFDGAINDMRILDSGKILIAGGFSSPRNRIFVINDNGTIDDTFSLSINLSGISKILVQNDGKIIACINNQLVRLNSNGSLDDTFSMVTVENSNIYSCALQEDGKILIGGNFTIVNGINKNGIARINTDGSLDLSFTGNGVNYQVNTINIQNDHKIILGGYFTTYNGLSRSRFVRINSDGTIDDSFDVGLGFDAGVGSSLIQNDGKILIAGYFTSYNATPINQIIRLNSTNLLRTDAFFKNMNPLLYPNPTTGKFNVDGETTFNDIEIYNSLGLLVSKEADLTNQKAGVYFVKLKFNNRIFPLKIIKI